MTKINSTKDYDSFKFLDEQRSINWDYVNTLAVSYEKYFDMHLIPIIVNKDFYISDGQHRFLAAKKLGLKIHYVVDDNYCAEKIATYNTVRHNWTLTQWVDFYAASGKGEYVKLKEFMKDSKLGATAAFQWISHDSGKCYSDLKNGRMIFKLKPETIEALMNTRILIAKCAEFDVTPIKLTEGKGFHRACRLFFECGLVEAEWFFQNLSKCYYFIKSRPNDRAYFLDLVEVYNFNKKKERLFIESDGRSTGLKKQD